MKNYFLILTDFAMRIPQRISFEQSIDLQEIIQKLVDNEFFPIITHYEDPNLFKLIKDLKIKYCWPAQSYIKNYRNLINNTLLILDKENVEIIPNITHFFAYENKLSAALIMKIKNLDSPTTIPIVTVEKFYDLPGEIGYPFVVKPVEGFASNGIELISCKKELEKYAKSHFKNPVLGTRGTHGIIAQAFLNNLKGDWKIIMVGHSCVSLWRANRPNDFRASGSGLFEFIKPPNYILDFALDQKNKLSAPWVSLDIADPKNNQPKLLEYQVVHFGTYTIEESLSHFYWDGLNWIEENTPLNFGHEIAKILVDYLRKQ